MSAQIIPVHFAIDLEPDERLPHSAASGFDAAGRALADMARRRGALEDATGAPARFGWYLRMDRHIGALYGDRLAIVQRYEKELAAAAAAGDEIGLHIHCAEPDGRGGWRANYADADAVDETIEEAVAAFTGFFGRAPRAARMGDMVATNRTVAKFAALAISFDLSVERGLRGASMRSMYPGTDSLGRREFMLNVPGAPYRPAPHNFRRPGGAQSLPLWVIPLSSCRVRNYLDPRALALSALSAAMSGLREIPARRVIRPQADYRGGELAAALNSLFDETRRANLCVAIRNDALDHRIEHFFETLTALSRERALQFVAADAFVRLAAAPDL